MALFNNNNNNNNSNNAANNANSTNTDEDGGKKKNLIIIVDKDSNDKLNSLFEFSAKPLQIPYRMRKLPDSFFNPPSSGSKSPSVSHSRENSADSAFGSGTTILGGATATTVNGLQIHHSRAHSSPASLGKIPVGLGIVQNTNNNTNNNNSNNSSNNNNTNNNNNSNSNNNNNNTNNSNKNSVNLSNINNNNPQSTLIKPLQHIHSRGRSYDIPSLQQQQFGELPPNWEQAKTQDGRIYYIK